MQDSQKQILKAYLFEHIASAFLQKDEIRS